MALSDNGDMLLLAKVVSVNGDTCSVDVDGLVLTDVRLRAVVNGENSKLLITPKVGSHVLLADQSGNMSQLAVIGYSEIEKIEVDTESITINGGENDGIVKVIELTEKLNNLEKDINALKDVLKNWTPVVYDGGTALKAGAAKWFGQKLTETKQEDIENELIKH